AGAVVFFFSSSRRHMSFSRDWSSDVCSSDLRSLRAERKVSPIPSAAAAGSSAFSGDARRSSSIGFELLELRDLGCARELFAQPTDRKSTRLNSSHVKISYAVFCLKKKMQIRL